MFIFLMVLLCISDGLFYNVVLSTLVMGCLQDLIST